MIFTHSTPSIKEIFDEISVESSTLKKNEILTKYKDNETLKDVLYLAKSKRIKFYIKQIPDYIKMESELNMPLSQVMFGLEALHKRKVTGNVAIMLLTSYFQSVTPDDAYILERIIEKDPKIGMGRTEINKVIPNLIEKTPYQGAISFDEEKAKKLLANGPCISQLKMDGRYNNAIIRNGEFELESRDGESVLLEDATFMLDLKQFPDCVLNGELTIATVEKTGIDDATGLSYSYEHKVSRYDGNGIIASAISIAKKRAEGKDVSKEIKKFETKHMPYREALDRITYTVWDVITIDEYYDNKSATPYKERLDKLKTMLAEIKPLAINLIESKEVSTYAEAMLHFQEVLALGEEGTILKSLIAPWKDGKPTWQIKMKLEMDVDLKIVGFNYGAKGTKNENYISSLNAESACGKVFTKPQGIKEDMMKYITDNQDSLLGTIVECKSCGLSNDSKGNYALLHPAFVRLRDDKHVADDLETIMSIEKMVKGLTPADNI